MNGRTSTVLSQRKQKNVVKGEDKFYKFSNLITTRKLQQRNIGLNVTSKYHHFLYDLYWVSVGKLNTDNCLHLLLLGSFMSFSVYRHKLTNDRKTTLKPCCSLRLADFASIFTVPFFNATIYSPSFSLLFQVKKLWNQVKSCVLKYEHYCNIQGRN